MTDRIVVVVSGQVASGKTTAAKLLRDQGFQYARISQAIATRWNEQLGSKPSRSWYQEMGMRLHCEIGQHGLCTETMKFIRDPNSHFVIDGARWREDIDFFRHLAGGRMVHLHLTAPIELRKSRFENREKDVTFEDADTHEVEREVNELAEMADARFDTGSGSIGELQAFLNSVLTRKFDVG